MSGARDFAIRADAVTRDFGAVRALDALSLEVPKGIVFGFLGPNGAGKTTAIRVFLGLIEPSAGVAEVLGRDTRHDSAAIRARCGALLEHPGLYERLSASDNLEFYGRAWHVPRRVMQDRIRELLTRFGLWERRDDPVGRWSRGMKQKLAVARAVLHRPELVFLDEPTSGLDPVATAGLREDLATLAAHEGVTVFLTTHNLNEAERLCAQVGVIRGGRLLAVGSPQQLRERQDSGRVEITARGLTSDVVALLKERHDVATLAADNGRLSLALAPGASVAPIVALLVHHAVEIEEVRRARATLEDAFLDLIGAEPTTNGVAGGRAAGTGSGAFG
jgi:ABC-2 type transport system ATP-binding protein